LSTTIHSQRIELEAAKQRTSELDSQFKESEQGSSLSASERSQRDARIAGLEGELQKARSEKNASDTAVALEEAEVRELQKQLSDDAESLRQQQELAARGSDVRDLVVRATFTSSMCMTGTETERASVLLGASSTPRGSL